MAYSFSHAAMIDTGFLYAMFDRRDSYHGIAVAKSDLIHNLPLAIPWPCLYETMNTRFVKDKLRIRQFETWLKRPHIRFIDDADYRRQAYEITLNNQRYISLTDMVMRLMLNDVNQSVKYLFTFNTADFIDICRKRGIELPCEAS